MKIMNKNMRGQSFRFRESPDSTKMVDAACDEDGCVELPDSIAEKLLQTPGWTRPVARKPRKPPTRPSAPAEPPKAPEPPEEPAEPQEAPEEVEDAEVPPYEEWAYADLKAEARKRLDNDPNFTPPLSGKTADIIAALELDDEKNS